MSELKFLIVGLGSIGRRHLNNLRALGETEISLFRTNTSTLPDQDLDGFSVFTDLTEALGNHPDAVIISNPTSLHMPAAVKAAVAGCALMIEKPLSHRLDDLMVFENVIRDIKQPILTAYQFRFNPGMRKIKKILDEQTLGQPVTFSCFWGEYLPGWHPWEDYRQSYAANADMGGGVVLTLSHPLDYLVWLLGDVVDLTAKVGNQSDLELNCEDHADVDLNFGSGVSGSLHLDYFTKPKQHRLMIECELGEIKWDYSNSNLIIEPKDGEKWIYPAPEEYGRNSMFLDEMKHFISCVRGLEQPICSYHDGKKALSLAEAILRSGRYQDRVILKKLTKDFI